MVTLYHMDVLTNTYPFVKADLEAGRETEASIVERLTNLWIKTITINKVRSQAHTFSSAR